MLTLPQIEKERLKYWKNPLKQPDGSPTGDFVGVLMKVLENRCRSESKFSIKEINGLLDDLAKAFDNKKKQEVFKTLVNGCSMPEQKWLVRIILKDLKIGIGH